MSERMPVDRVIGNLDARITMMESRLARMEASLDEVHEAVISARGAWRAVAWIAGVTGTLAGGLAALIHWLMPTR